MSYESLVHNNTLISSETREMRGFFNIPMFNTKHNSFCFIFRLFFPLILEIETEMIHKKRGGSLFYKLRKPACYDFHKTLDFCLFVCVLRYTSFLPLDIYILNSFSHFSWSRFQNKIGGYA